MYTATVSAADLDPEPWRDPGFAARLASLCAGSPRVAYFYEKPDTSTFRYRVYNMIQALEGTGTGAAWFDRDDLGRMDRVLDRCDVLVICRTRYSDGVNRMVAAARARHRRVLFDTDDLVFDTAYAHTIVDTLDRPTADPAVWDEWFAYLGRLGATMKLCDGTVTTNPALAARAAAFSGLPGAVVPNFLNREQMVLSRRIMAAKRESGMARDDRFHLGYFSGTPTHNRDFAIAEDALARLLDRRPDVVLRIAGFLDLGPALQRHRDRVELHPLRDFLALQQLIGSTEVNLVPLQDNVFTNCKSELKYFEAAAVGSLTLAAPTLMFRDCIAPDRTGLLVPAQDWDAALADAVDGFAARDGMIEAACAHAEARYGWDTQAPAIQAALFG